MQNNTLQTSSWFKYLQGLFFLLAILYFGRSLFIPLFFGLFIAIILYPVCKWLEQRGWQKGLAIAACLLLVAILLALLLSLLSWQLGAFSKDLPQLMHRIDAAAGQLQAWLLTRTGITVDVKQKLSERISADIADIFPMLIQTTGATLLNLFLTPIYTALLLYHRSVFVQALKLATPLKYQPQLNDILRLSLHTYFKYVKGMVIIYLIVGILNSIGLLALGINHALFFGMLCAVMTIIPYFGIIISALLPISMAWMQTGNVLYPLGVIAVFTFVQYLEANIIFPKVVGMQLNVSTLAALVGMMAGGILWGMAGMVLFIPLVAILKIISAHFKEWEVVHLLLSRK